MSARPVTIGMLPGWPVYGSIFLDRFLQYVIGGVRAAALDHGCNLMVACGVSRTPGMRSLHTAWPVVSPDCDYVPLGHWNTDGLIVAAPLRSEERSRYLRSVIEQSFPVVCIGSGEGTPAIVMDNEGGIHKAVEHLIRHGHRRIAFIAGDPLDHGDSTLRLQAYRRAVEQFEADPDPRLVAYGYHYREGGRKAMEQILTTGIPFTAVVASNDVSAYGAMEMLRRAGRRIPMDVAVIGFDDQPSAAGQIPPLTSVHYPLFEVGVKAVEMLLERIAHPEAPAAEIRIPACLAIRESCGCSPSYQVDRQEIRLQTVPQADDLDSAEQAVRDALQPGLGAGILHDPCDTARKFVSAFLQAVASRESTDFLRVLEEILDSTDPAEDHCDLWQSAVSVLRLKALPLVPDGQSTVAENLLHQARLIVTDHAERLNLRTRLSAGEINHQIGWMTTRMFSANSEKGILRIFAEHLSEIGIRFAQVALFEPRPDNPLGGITFYADLWKSVDRPDLEDLREICADCGGFPAPDILPGEAPYALVLVPITFQDEPMGFAVFDAAALEPLATITRQLAAALKLQQLHDQTEDLSLVDPETGVQNRRFFDLFLRREMDRSRRYRRGLTLMMIELDGWKHVASSRGAMRSREALRTLAQRITLCTRRGSDVVCRYSSETFVLLLPETGRAGAQNIAEAVRRSIEEEEEFRGLFDVGIGIAVAGDDNPTEDADSLMAAADRALCQAKSVGRNRTEIVKLAAPPDTRKR